jgi:maleamate amidohydrolase
VTSPHPLAGFAGRLRPGSRPAVLAIDMMAAYYTEGSPFCLPSRDSLDGAAQVLAAARAVGVPVLHTVVSYSEDDLANLVFLRKVPALRQLTGDNPLGRLMPEVAPEEGEPVLVKQQASAFFGTDLSERLAELGIDTVVITGVSTSGCVRATAVDAVARNLVTIVVRDAVGDRAAGVGEASLSDLQTKYAEVVDLDTAVGYLRETAV